MAEGKEIIKSGFILEYRLDGVFLTVMPEKKTGMEISLEKIEEFLKRKKMKEVDMNVVKRAVEMQDDIENKIAPVQEEQKINAEMLVKILNGKMSASIFIMPPEGGQMLSAQKILDILKEENVVFGIDKNTIETISKDPIYNQDIEIAQGTQPIHGENAKMEYHFQLSKKMKPKILEDGKVDFHELDLIENVAKGDVLVTITPHTPGLPGKNVLGEEVSPIPGKPAKIPAGKNVELSENGKQLIAAIDGHVAVANQKVNVYALYEVNGDVDNSVGNIDFVGNVVVKGNVMTGFSIKAGGTVEVQGVVEGATIKCIGDIVLRRGMQGLNKGNLITEGNIVAKYIEHSHLSAKGDITSEAVMHSHVECGGTLVLGGRKGLFVGGIAKVGREIVAKMIGSPMATVTELEVGVPPHIREKHKKLKAQIPKLEQAAKKTDQAIEMLKKLESVSPLDEQKQQFKIKTIKTKEYIDNQLKEIKKEYEQIENRLKAEAGGKIKALNIIYPGVKIMIGSSMLYVKENIKYSTLYKSGGDIRVGEYEK